MTYVLQTENLSKCFGGIKAVNNVNMKIKKGDIYGFIGRNGAGKTTLIRMVTGMASPNEGSLKLFESDDLIESRGKIGTIVENPGLYINLSAKVNMMSQAKLLGIEKPESKIAELLTLVGLSIDMRKRAGDFSLGMKQRLALAIALLDNPQFLILDEPTNGLDPEGIKEIRNLILKLNEEYGMTVLISSHILGELDKLATRYGIIDKGVLIDEFSAEELHSSSNSYIKIIVKQEEMDITIKALKELDITGEFKKIGENELKLTGYTESIQELNYELFNKNIKVEEITEVNETLEDYFMKKIGGNL